MVQRRNENGEWEDRDTIKKRAEKWWRGNSQLTILTQPQIDNTHPDNSNWQFPPSPVSSYSAVHPQLLLKLRNFTNNFLNSHLKVRNFQITNNSEILHFTNKQTFQKFYKVKAQSPSISHLEILNFYKQEKKSKINKVIEKRWTYLHLFTFDGYFLSFQSFVILGEI